SAINASTSRVNKYKFDYGALTRTEQQVMRRGMPFYTYMRKAIPTLADSLYLSPRNLVQTNKAFNSLTGNDGKFDAHDLPSYLKEAGFMSLMGGSEPTGITGSFLPQDVFSNAFENPAANLNPLLKGIFETQTG